MNESKYFVLDAGGQMTDYVNTLLIQLEIEGHHVVHYLTDAPYLLQLEQISEDEYLDHYQNYLKQNN